MSGPVIAETASNASARHVVRTSWRPIAILLGVGLLLLGTVFNREIGAAIQTWIQSTAYNHCFLVIPITAFLLWERRADIAERNAGPTPWLALLGLPIAMVWLLAERLGIMEGRQLAAVSFAELLFLVVLGWRFWRTVSGPLLYLYFLVPFGEFLTPKLQDITTFFIRHGLEILGIPAYIDGYFIEIPQGTFLVAEACAGLRFLIASIAFGCLYALMMYRSPLRRGVFIAVSVVVPIVANGLRGLGIVYLGYLLNSARAAAADHLIYGWIFFSFVILLLIALGLPFRQDEMPSQRLQRNSPSLPISVRQGLAAMIVLVIVAACGPTVAAGLAMADQGVVELPAAIDLGTDCATLAGATTDPNLAGIRTQRITCGDVTVDLTWEAFPTRATAAPVMQERRRLTRRIETEDFTESWLPDNGDQRRAWQIMRSSDPAYELAAAIWIDGSPIRPGLSMRLRMALNSLLGSAHAPIVMTVTPAAPFEGASGAERQQPDTSVTTFLQAHPELDLRVGADSAAR